MAATLLGSRGRRSRRKTTNSTSTPATTSTTATQVFGVLGLLEAAAFPSANAAMTPTTSVTPNAPRKNHKPVRIGRSPTTSASTDRNSVTGESMAASATSTSSVSTEVIARLLAPAPLSALRGCGLLLRVLELAPELLAVGVDLLLDRLFGA